MQKDNSLIPLQHPVFTLGCAVIHLAGLYVLYVYFLAMSPDTGYQGMLYAYIHKARSLFYQIYGFRSLMLLVVILSGAFTVRGVIGILNDSQYTGRVLKWLVPGLFLYTIVLGLGYVARPDYIDPGESHVTMLSLLLKEGNPIYSEIDNPDLANTWYGPVLFLVNAVFLFIIPDPILATKIRGLVGLVVGILVFFYVGRKRYGESLSLAAVGYILMSLFISCFFALGNRADSLIICLTLCAAGGAMIRRDRIAMLVTAICMAGAVNSKITAAAYMLPIAVYLLEMRGWKFTIRTVTLSIGFFLLPFLVYPLFPLNHYLNYVLMATSNKFEEALLWENFGFAVFMLLPVLCLTVVGSKDRKDLKVTGLRYTGVSIIAMTMICLTASKEGSGFYHLLAFAPGLGLLWIDLSHRKSELLKPRPNLRSTLAVLVYGWLVGCFLLTFSGQLQMLYGFKLVSKPNAGQEIRQILKDYPTARIAMGYGDADDYADERLSYRPLLFPTTRDNPMNAVSMVEFICSNKPIPSSAVARFREEAYDIFLIPSGGAPFSAEIFQGLEVQEQFSSHYERLEQREFFEIWRRKSLRN